MSELYRGNVKGGEVWESPGHHQPVVWEDSSTAELATGRESLHRRPGPAPLFLWTAQPDEAGGLLTGTGDLPTSHGKDVLLEAKGRHEREGAV